MLLRRPHAPTAPLCRHPDQPRGTRRARRPPRGRWWRCSAVSRVGPSGRVLQTALDQVGDVDPHWPGVRSGQQCMAREMPSLELLKASCRLQVARRSVTLQTRVQRSIHSFARSDPQLQPGPGLADCQDGAVGVLRWDGGRNVRDLGGLPVRGRGRTRAGALIRSADLDELSPAGLDSVRALRPGRLIDLRSRHEIVSVHPLGAEPFYRSLCFVDPDRDGERRPESERTKADLYTGSLDRNGVRIADIAIEIAQAPSGPVIVHCKAGADRTGMLCALLLEVAGVEPDAIVADYAATSPLDGSPVSPHVTPLACRPLDSRDRRDHDRRPCTRDVHLRRRRTISLSARSHFYPSGLDPPPPGRPRHPPTEDRVVVTCLLSCSTRSSPWYVTRVEPLR